MNRQQNTPTSSSLLPEVQSLLLTIDGQLYLLGWQRSHPKVTQFVDLVRQKHPALNLEALEQVPLNYLKKLSEFLKIYSNCDQLIKLLNLDWDSSTIQKATEQYGGLEKMPLIGWMNLYQYLENQYFLSDMPVPSDSKPKKEKKKRSPVKNKN